MLKAGYMTIVLVLSLFVALPAIFAFFCETSLCLSDALKPAFSVGTPVVYRKEEVSTHPTADARDVYPSPHGDDYYYTIINYLRVTELLDDGRIIAVAGDNKRLCFWPNDSSFRKARLFERLMYLRFPHV